MGNVENITDGVLEKAVTTDGSGIGRPMGIAKFACVYNILQFSR